MKKKNSVQQPSKVRNLLIKAQIALEENRYEEALSIVKEINAEDMKTLPFEELQAIDRVLAYLNELSEEKRRNLADELKKIQAGKEYLS
ncbi:hypothetical protein V4D30_05170 [Thermodesulfovibrio sp. 3907-1M]|uniref:Uncharacterized protein n=1 Tax=Thermodesulfovibrio autotrophicus TaxID=3118333 RepID=A0AAU8GWP4_9BACT